jgi:hypothetical protein
MRTRVGKSMQTTMLALAMAVLGSLGGCDSVAELGEECTISGNEDGCVDGAICAKQGDVNVCLTRCKTPDVCPMGTMCMPVDSSWKNACMGVEPPPGTAGGAAPAPMP